MTFATVAGALIWGLSLRRLKGQTIGEGSPTTADTRLARQIRHAKFGACWGLTHAADAAGLVRRDLDLLELLYAKGYSEQQIADRLDLSVRQLGRWRSRVEYVMRRRFLAVGLMEAE